MRRERNSCIDVIAARNSLSKNCLELQHPVEMTRISFPSPCSNNLPAEPENHSPGWLGATVGCPSTVHSCAFMGSGRSRAQS